MKPAHLLEIDINKQHMYTEREIKQIVDKLNIFDKYKVYIDYFVDTITPSIVWYDNLHYDNLRKSNSPHIQKRKQHILLNKMYRSQSFDEFISEHNYEEIRLGDNWKERGFAQPNFIYMTGIYYRLYKRQNTLLPKLNIHHEKDRPEA